MGLLDEAIRDHLELKRRRGADPTEIAREEHEVLEAIVPAESGGEAIQSLPEPTGAAVEADAPPLLSGIGEETVELDMEAVLGEQPSDPPPEPLPGQERLSFE